MFRHIPRARPSDRNMRPCLLAFLLSAPVLAQVQVTYLANEGVLLTAGSTKVLIDALFRDSLGDYPRHSAETQAQLESGKAPFDGVGLALATHYHLDHWDAGAISRFLSANQTARFASTPPAGVMLPSAVRSRVDALWTEDGAPVAPRDIAGARVGAVPLVHGTTPNLAFRIEMGGRTVMHLGDADASAVNHERLAAKPAPDVLMVPFWWLMDEKTVEFLGKRWKPRQIVAIHFGARDTTLSAEKVRASLPGVWACTRPGESKSY
jgi:L-ascorbate metabolism protein UlaG (beta-lactamase superfamily)